MAASDGTNGQYNGPERRKVDEAMMERIEKVVSEAICKGMVSGGCPLPPKMREHSVHLYGALADIGDGDVGNGIRKLRSGIRFIAELRKKEEDWLENHKFVSDVRRRHKWLGKSVAGTTLAIVVTSLIYTIWKVVEFVVDLTRTGGPTQGG